MMSTPVIPSTEVKALTVVAIVETQVLTPSEVRHAGNADAAGRILLRAQTQLYHFRFRFGVTLRGDKEKNGWLQD